MIDAFADGSDIVYGVHSDRGQDSWVKRTTARAFYRVMGALGAKTVANHADFRLMSRRALDALAEFTEVNLFLRGLVPMVGFRSSVVTYRRGARRAGETKYPMPTMVAFAVEGITSLSVRPIRFVTALGLAVFLASLVTAVVLGVLSAGGTAVQGWAWVLVSVWAAGALQLLAIGLIGEYIGKTYVEVKRRPRYIVESVLIDP
jgi:hypothetical protein